jgi:hypothetical protein
MDCKKKEKNRNSLIPIILATWEAEIEQDRGSRSASTNTS